MKRTLALLSLIFLAAACDGSATVGDDVDSTENSLINDGPNEVPIGGKPTCLPSSNKWCPSGYYCVFTDLGNYVCEAKPKAGSTIACGGGAPNPQNPHPCPVGTECKPLVYVPTTPGPQGPPTSTCTN